MIDPTRAEAVEAFRQELKLAGHKLYAASSDLARDQSADTVARQVVAVVQVVDALRTRIDELNATLG